MTGSKVRAPAEKLDFELSSLAGGGGSPEGRPANDDTLF